MRTGGCYCGAVRYELRGEPGPLVNCHCRDCRRVHGAAFAAGSLIRKADLRFTSGEEAVQEYETQNGFRYFCERCGGRLFNRARSAPEFVVLLVASLDDEPTDEPVMHINVESRAPWYEILDDRPQHQAMPPGISLGVDE